MIKSNGPYLSEKKISHVLYTGLFISPSGISDPCGTVAGMVTPKGSMSTEEETLPSFCPTLQVLDMLTSEGS